MMNEIAVKTSTDIQNLIPFEAQTASISLVSAKAAKALALRQENFEAVEQAEIVILEQQRIIAAEYEKTFSAGQPEKNSTSSGGILHADGWCKLLGTSQTTVLRWKDKLLDEAKYQVCLEAVHKKTRQMIGMEQDGKNHIPSVNNDWYTPEEYIEAARVVLAGIDLDPATRISCMSCFGRLRTFVFRHQS